MSRRSPLRNYSEYGLLRLLLALLGPLPAPLARAAAGALLKSAAALIPRWRTTARRNLELAFPSSPARERDQIYRGSLDNLARVLSSLAQAHRVTKENISSVISYEGFQHYQQAKSRGRGVIFLTAHLGNWELSATAHSLFGHPMIVMVRPLDNPLLDRWLDERRKVSGNRTLSKSGSMKTILRALRGNGDVGILADQNAAGDDGVFVDFFGIPAAATQGVARLAAHSGASVIPGFAFWNESAGRYVLKFYEPLELADTADVTEITRRCQAAIERAVRERPDQWLWIHRRWKTRPPGEKPLY